MKPRTPFKKKICVKYLKGKCKRDSNCYYSHENPNLYEISSNSNSLKINGVCLFHLKGKCFYGDNCWYLHPIDIKFWIIEWFADKVNLVFNNEMNLDGKQTINDFHQIGEELIFLLTCFRVKKAQISTVHIDFSTLNFANDYIFNIQCSKTLLSVMNLRTLQLSIGSFELLLRKLDEINVILTQSIKLKNFLITDNNKLIVFEGRKNDWFIENEKILYFIRQIKDSFLEYFEIEAIRPSNEYDQSLKAYIFMIYSLIKSQLAFLKFSLNQDITLMINIVKSKIIITINFSSISQSKRLIQDFWDELVILSIFKEVTFNFISDWFSGFYTHEIMINKITYLSALELDFRRVNINVDQLELLWNDIKSLVYLNNLQIMFPNAYIDQKVLASINKFIPFFKDSIKTFILKVKVMFVSEDLFKTFFMNFVTFSSLQRLELNLDFNLLQLWTEDIGKKTYFENFLKKLFKNNFYLLRFIYVDRTIRFQLCDVLEKWLIFKKLLTSFCHLMKRDKNYKFIRKEVLYETFYNIHLKKYFKNLGIEVKKPLFSCFDFAENETEEAFYERFLQI